MLSCYKVSNLKRIYFKHNQVGYMVQRNKLEHRKN